MNFASHRKKRQKRVMRVILRSPTHYFSLYLIPLGGLRLVYMYGKERESILEDAHWHPQRSIKDSEGDAFFLGIIKKGFLFFVLFLVLAEKEEKIEECEERERERARTSGFVSFSCFVFSSFCCVTRFEGVCD